MREKKSIELQKEMKYSRTECFTRKATEPAENRRSDRRPPQKTAALKGDWPLAYRMAAVAAPGNMDRVS